MGLTSLYKGNYDRAIKLFNKSLKIKLATIGENSPARATSYNNIGSAWDSKGEYDKAIGFYEKALKIYIPKLGESHPSTIVIKNNLAYAFRDFGSKYQKEKNYKKAIDYYSRALLLHKKILSNDPKRYSDEVFDDIHKIIQTHQITQPQKAKEMYSESLDYYQKLFKQNKKSHAKNYIKTIIEGVEQFDVDSDKLEEAKEILAILPPNSETKGLLLQIEELEGS
jgi:tetratricopeptide (TPR) repeat protein